MFGINNKFICIAGKNQCSVEFVKFLIKKIDKKYILICPNKSDNGHDGWQPSLKKFAKQKKLKIITLKRLYKIKNLIFISIEFEKIINTKMFKTDELYNFHFSILPKFRGCHTNFYQILFGEKKSGVSLHKIDNGIDTGPVAKKIIFKINQKHNAKENYIKLMKYSVKLFKSQFKNIQLKKLKFTHQKLKKGSYFSRDSVNYEKIKNIEFKKKNIKLYNKIRALIFPPFQYPVINGIIIKKVSLMGRKIKINDQIL